MESLKELRKICEKEPHKEIWIHVFFNKISLPFTRLLLYTPITPNQVTISSLIIGILGVFLISFPSHLISIIGYLFIFLHYFTDFCDGQIARYRKKFSLKGKYWDYLGHIVVYPMIFLAAGIHLFNQSGDVLYLLTGTFSTLSAIFYVVNEKCYILTAGVKSSQLHKYWTPQERKITFKGVIFRIHKTVKFHLYVVFYFLIAEIITVFLEPEGIKINLIFYLLLFFLVIHSLTFLLQIIIYSKNLES